MRYCLGHVDLENKVVCVKPNDTRTEWFDFIDCLIKRIVDKFNHKIAGGYQFNPSTPPPPPPPPPPTRGFLKNVSSKETLKPWFFVIFNIVKSHIFPENLIEISEFVQKI